MKWIATVGFWGTWLLLTLVSGGVVFLVTVFAGDNPAKRAAAERLMSIAFVLIAFAFVAGIVAMCLWPGWPGWLIACGLTVLVPVIVMACMSR